MGSTVINGLRIYVALERARATITELSAIIDELQEHLKPLRKMLADTEHPVAPDGTDRPGISSDQSE